MSYHIISIDAPDCNISVKREQLCVTSIDGVNQVPIEDVASIVITSIKCNLSNTFLIEAAKHKVSVIICDSFKPSVILLPADRSTDTQILRNITQLSPQLKRRLWKKTIDVKCSNQWHLAKLWNKTHILLDSFSSLLKSEKGSKESECAKIYWRIFSDTFANGTFKRERGGSDYNAFFNYAYAILLSCVLRNLFALGIDPTFGIHHSTREHATPLAYDLMEPFRIIFDYKVAQWIISHDDNSECSITKEFRAYITATLLEPVSYQDKQFPLKSVIEQVIRSFRASVLAMQSGPYEPWTISTTKWDG